MAEPMFKKGGNGGGGKKNVFSRVPKWAWYVSAGILVAGVVYYFQSRSAVTEGGELEEEGAVGYTDASMMPGIVVPNVMGTESVAGELNTDIPSETMSVFGTMFEGLFGLIQAGQETNERMLEILANGGSGGAGAGAGGAGGAGDPGGVVTVPPPAPAAPPPAPKPNPATRLEPGYHAGQTVNMGPNAKKNFPHSVGWVRIGDGGKGKDHWIDVHVRFCNSLERWRVRPNAKGSPWQKIWEGGRPQICM